MFKQVFSVVRRQEQCVLGQIGVVVNNVLEKRVVALADISEYIIIAETILSVCVIVLVVYENIIGWNEFGDVVQPANI